MAIDKPATPIDGLIEQEPQEELQIAIENPDSVAIATEDGGMVIDFDPQEEKPDSEFGSNLVDFIDDQELEHIGSDLISAFNMDRDSRKEWEETYTKGLDQLGLKIEERTQPWNGACGVFHPMLSEAVIRFQSQAIAEIFPAAGPVKTKIVGKITDEKEKQAQRVEDYMNYLLTYEMAEYRTETEKLLFSLPLAGSAFRKVYYDPTLGRPSGIFVPSEDVVVNYGASDLDTCERATHVMRMSSNDIRKMQVNGFYRDVEVASGDRTYTDVQEKYDELTGEMQNNSYDQRHTVLEMQVNLDLKGFEDESNGQPTGIALPYVVTVDYPSGIVLSIRRNYYEDDPQKKRRSHFVHYQYLPGIGFYGFGLIHMIGGLSRGATSALRQLLDAGTLANLPAGFKSRGIRIRDDEQPFQPGEFRDVDAPGGNIKDQFQILPFKEPSGTLFQLLGFVVQAGQRFAAIADMQLGEDKQNRAVGTTIALLERGSRVMSAIHKRCYYAMRQEFRLLSKIFSEYLPPVYPYAVYGADRAVKIQDFDDRVDVIPVADPNIFSMSQRVTLANENLKIAMSNPQMHNLHEAYRRVYEALGTRQIDTLLKPAEIPIPEDPATENAKALQMKMLKLFQNKIMMHI